MTQSLPLLDTATKDERASYPVCHYDLIAEKKEHFRRHQGIP